MQLQSTSKPPFPILHIPGDTINVDFRQMEQMQYISNQPIGCHASWLMFFFLEGGNFQEEISGRIVWGECVNPYAGLQVSTCSSCDLAHPG